jgi:hypothetical protein
MPIANEVFTINIPAPADTRHGVRHCIRPGDAAGRVVITYIGEHENFKEDLIQTRTVRWSLEEEG